MRRGDEAGDALTYRECPERAGPAAVTDLQTAFERTAGVLECRAAASLLDPRRVLDLNRRQRNPQPLQFLRDGTGGHARGKTDLQPVLRLVDPGQHDAGQRECVEPMPVLPLLQSQKAVGAPDDPNAPPNVPCAEDGDDRLLRRGFLARIDQVDLKRPVLGQIHPAKARNGARDPGEQVIQRRRRRNDGRPATRRSTRCA